MPAPRHSRIASTTSGRTGSIIPQSPKKQRSCSRKSGSWEDGIWFHALPAAASTRSAWSAIALFCDRISCRNASVIGCFLPSRQTGVHRFRISSGAPFVQEKYVPSFARWIVVMRFRIESNGASPTRGYWTDRLFFGHPSFCASLTNAHSVGSPTASPFSSGSASEQSAMTDTRRFISLPSCFTTVILFWVSVPVLSEQITCVQPSVSTAVSFRITAFRFDILVTPMESTIVTTAASPSGIAATARLTATIKVFKMFCGVTPSFKIPTMKITAQMASTITLKILLSWFSRFCSGVLSSADCVRTWAIFPISVFIPVPVITARPRP